MTRFIFSLIHSGGKVNVAYYLYQGYYLPCRLYYLVPAFYLSLNSDLVNTINLVDLYSLEIFKLVLIKERFLI